MYDPSLMVQQGPNPGERFAQAFQQGQQTRQQNMAKAAMAALVQDPNNAKALAALAQVDPQAAMQFRQQQIEAAKAHVGEHYDNILKGAELIRQTKPIDQASWDQTRALAARAGIDISQVPQQFDEQYVNGIVQLADAFKPQTETQDPGIIREFDIATQRGLVPPGTTYQQYVTMRNPGMSAPVTIPYGSTVTPGGQPQAQIPSVASPDDAMKLPPGSQFRLPDGRIGTVPGGAGGNASGGFPQ